MELFNRFLEVYEPFFEAVSILNYWLSSFFDYVYEIVVLLFFLYLLRAHEQFSVKTLSLLDGIGREIDLKKVQSEKFIAYLQAVEKDFRYSNNKIIGDIKSLREDLENGNSGPKIIKDIESLRKCLDDKYHPTSKNSKNVK